MNAVSVWCDEKHPDNGGHPSPSGSCAEVTPFETGGAERIQMREHVIEISTEVFHMLQQRSPGYVSWAEEEPGPTQEDSGGRRCVHRVY